MPNGIDIDFLPCGIIKTDNENNVEYVNQYALDLLYCRFSDDIVGLNINELVSIASRIFLDSYVFPMLMENGKADEIQLSVIAAGGKKKPIVANVKINSDKTIFWTFLSCANRDQLYNEMLGARDTLQSQALNLAQLNTGILERQSDLQTFCHSLSHDFTGPLLRVKHLVKMAVEDLEQAGIEAREEFELLEAAARNIDILIELTNGLVEYLVADINDSDTAQDENVDLEDAISNILALCEQENKPTPVVHCVALPTIYGNKAQIQVLFKNLIENAIKYCENDPEITVSYTEDTANFRGVIAINDNGIGMSDTSSIFTPFKRLNTTDRYKGSGLGLSIVKKLMTNFDGDIRVESTPGKGSTFYLSLPLNVILKDKQVVR